jgi:hypothetical protein
MKNRFIFFTLFFITYSTIFANVPYEKFFINNDLPREFLKRTIGILTINSGVKRNITVDIYNDDFLKTNILNLRDNSQPISNFGYHPPEDTLVSNFRYLVIDENERFLKIVYDHNNKKYAWVLKKQLNERFYLKTKYINDLKTNFGEFLSLFGLTTKNFRKIYNQPTDDSNFEIIFKKDFSNTLIKIMEQQNEFVKIAIVNEDCDNNIEIIKELGWVKIKDDTGALNIWIVNKDVC